MPLPKFRSSSYGLHDLPTQGELSAAKANTKAGVVSFHLCNKGFVAHENHVLCGAHLLGLCSNPKNAFRLISQADRFAVSLDTITES